MERLIQERMAPPIAADSASQEVLIPAVGTPSQAQTPVRDAQRGRSETPKTVARPSLLRKLNNGGKLAVLQATRQRAEANNVSLTQQAAADGILSGTLSKLCKKVAELEANKNKKSMHAGRTCKVVESLDALVKTFVNDRRSKHLAVHKSHIVDHLVEKSVGFMSRPEAVNFYRKMRARIGLRELRRTEKKPVILQEDVDSVGVFCDLLAKYEHLLGQEGAPRIEIFTVDETPINAESCRNHDDGSSQRERQAWNSHCGEQRW